MPAGGRCGSSPATAARSPVPGSRRIRNAAAGSLRQKDPRVTATCEIADLHLPVKPGSDVLLFNGLLTFLAQQHALDQHYIERHTRDFDSALTLAQQDAPTLEVVSQGRPICALCGRPVNPEGHFCPKRNGHTKDLVVQ